MLALAAIAVTCWLCAFIATPRKPRLGNEVEELVYSRLLGGQQRLFLLALLVTMGGLLTELIIVRPSPADPDFNTLLRTSVPCVHATYDPAPCVTALPSVLLVREIQDDGRSRVVTTVAASSPSIPRPSRP
jgi:hypothetical protein